MKLSARPPAPPTPPPSSSPSSASFTLLAPFQACLIPSSRTVNYFPFSSSSTVPFFWSVVTQCRSLPRPNLLPSGVDLPLHLPLLHLVHLPPQPLSPCHLLPSFWTTVCPPVNLQYTDGSRNLSACTCTRRPKPGGRFQIGRNHKKMKWLPLPPSPRDCSKDILAKSILIRWLQMCNCYTLKVLWLTKM